MRICAHVLGFYQIIEMIGQSAEEPKQYKCFSLSVIVLLLPLKCPISQNGINGKLTRKLVTLLCLRVLRVNFMEGWKDKGL